MKSFLLSVVRVIGLLLVVTLASLPAAFAQDGTPAPEPAAFDWTLYVIPFLTPLVVLGAKKLFTRIPGAWLPYLATMIGVALEALNSFINGTALNPMLGAALGLAGVGIRELQFLVINKKDTPPAISSGS